jgi:hypothetical protein
MRSAVALFLFGTTVLGLNNYENINLNQISGDNSTVVYQANPLYETCTCDLTSLSCDLNCCCDKECTAAIREAWTDAESCSNIDYNTLYGAPLSSCVKDEQIYQYNRNHGLNAYFDPFTKLFCIYISNSPKMDYYYD